MTHKVGKIIVICEEEDDICEDCGNADELRPYGPKKENGKRMRICYACAMKDVEATEAAMKETLYGEKPDA